MNNKFDKIVSVIGLGYIGLPTAIIIAKCGYKVYGFDIDNNIVNNINLSKPNIIEPFLEERLKEVVSDNSFKAFTELKKSEIFIICVPTPLKNYGQNKVPEPNTEYIMDTIVKISQVIKDGDIIIIESTSPVGTTEQAKNLLKKMNVNTDKINLAYCPERVLPGKIFQEFLTNNRIVGGLNSESSKIVAKFYRSLIQNDVIETDAKTAEMCKLIENSFRDVNIAFANELSMICEQEQIDVWNLINLANQHPRVNILQPSSGVGGHCIAVDPWFIVSRNKQISRLIKTAREVNIGKTKWAIDQIKIKCAEFNLKYKTVPRVVCMGLSFKPDIDDMRESPSLQIAESLVTQNFDVVCIEPNISYHAKLNLIKIENIKPNEDVVVVLVKHSYFIKKHTKEFLKKMNILDFCGLLD